MARLAQTHCVWAEVLVSPPEVFELSTRDCALMLRRLTPGLDQVTGESHVAAVVALVVILSLMRDWLEHCQVLEVVHLVPVQDETL